MKADLKQNDVGGFDVGKALDSLKCICMQFLSSGCGEVEAPRHSEVSKPLALALCRGTCYEQ